MVIFKDQIIRNRISHITYKCFHVIITFEMSVVVFQFANLGPFLVQIIQTTFISKVLQKGICILLPSIKVFIAHLWLIKYTAAHRPFKSSFDCFLPYLYVISDDAWYYIRRYNPTNFESEEYIWSSHFNVSQRIVQLILIINKSFLRNIYI